MSSRNLDTNQLFTNSTFIISSNSWDNVLLWFLGDFTTTHILVYFLYSLFTGIARERDDSETFNFQVNLEKHFDRYFDHQDQFNEEWAKQLDNCDDYFLVIESEFRA